ncbi:MAG: sulfur carrier protein ThiS [Rhizobium sp.]|nr:sulfur carrier protein ThiS [Rhizobium sp.]
MMLIVNGEEQVVEAMTLAEVLAALDFEGDWLATAVNGDLVPRDARERHIVKTGDRIEVLSPMQGG